MGIRRAIVAAYDLQPTQLEWNIIGRRPDEDIVASTFPEVARIYNGEVFIEPYFTEKIIKRRGTKMGKAIVITSGKGGVGKTTTTANIGTGLVNVRI